MLKLAFSAILIASAWADLYMHNPRGSNNRLNEQNNNANNNNRMFDSQNNNKGGYCWGDPLTYYEGSHLSVEWTNQHSCGTETNECQIVIQMMCTDVDDDTYRIRDGLTTETIPNDVTDFNDVGAGGEYTYGMHEDFYYYRRCSGRQRNMGLFIADRNLNGRSARFTRQNNNGNRDGFECPEERDYYPYWAPTPWIDIAVLTTDSGGLCGMFRSESQNVESKWECVDPTNNNYPFGYLNNNNNNEFAPITETECDAAGGMWMETESWGVGAPDCEDAPYARDNHLGNGKDGYANVFNMTMPSDSGSRAFECLQDDDCICALRLRYNISTFDTDNWGPGDAAGYGAPMSGNEWIDAEYNDDMSPIMQDPIVDFMGHNLTLALNTNQYGRTFQDRSYTFYLKQRPDSVAGAIYNLNVRGKRGNIVQTYPAVEYDFVPTMLDIPEYSYIHFQWTGCDNNAANQAGEGTDRTDRHNICQIAHMGLNYPLTWDEMEEMGSSDLLFSDEEEALYFGTAGQDLENCPTYAQLYAQNANNENDVEEDETNCMVLNAASRHFDGGVIQYGFGRLGKTYNYMSTRNNNFTNRSQKAMISVTTAIPAYAIGIIAGAGVALVLAAFVGTSYYCSRVKPHSKLGTLWTTTVTKIGH